MYKVVYLWVASEFTILDVLTKNMDVFISVFLIPEKQLLGDHH